MKKDHLIQVRASESELNVLNAVALQANQSRSELLRSSICRLSSRDFDSVLALEYLPTLETIVNDFLAEVESGKVFSVEDISDIAPAFIMDRELNVKIPTLKIRVIEPIKKSDEEFDKRRLFYESIEKENSALHLSYEAGPIWPRSSDIVVFPVYHLFKSNIALAQELAEEISAKLQKNGRQVEIWPSYFLKSVLIHFNSNRTIFSTNFDVVKSE